MSILVGVSCAYLEGHRLVGSWQRLLACFFFLLGLFVCRASNGQTAQPAFITIDAPGAGTGYSQGTVATVINAAGVIVGYEIDPNYICHGFVRKPDGGYVTFDTPLGQHGAATCPLPTGINQAGAVTGAESDPSFGCATWPDTAGGCGGAHGFVQQSNGTITIFDGPINLSFSNPVTIPLGISFAGAIVGQYNTCDQSGCSTSFLRTPNGTFITFDAPGTNPFSSPRAVGVNGSGTIAGLFGDYNRVARVPTSPDGTFTIIDAPGKPPPAFRPIEGEIVVH
jgi:hypothetical protein